VKGSEQITAVAVLVRAETQIWLMTKKFLLGTFHLDQASTGAYRHRFLGCVRPRDCYSTQQITRLMRARTIYLIFGECKPRSHAHGRHVTVTFGSSPCAPCIRLSIFDRIACPICVGLCVSFPRISLNSEYCLPTEADGAGRSSCFLLHIPRGTTSGCMHMSLCMRACRL